MPRRIAVLALILVAGCAARERGVVKPSALDPALATLDGKSDRNLEYPVVGIGRFDGFLGEAARVEATFWLARRLGGELRAAVLAIAKDRDLERVDRRAWTSVAREVAARDDLTEAERERLRKAAEPLAALLPHVGEVPRTAERLVIDGTTLIEQAQRGLAPEEEGRLAPALDATNVALMRLRDAGARAPNLAKEIALGLDAVAVATPSETPAVVPAQAGAAVGPAPATTELPTPAAPAATPAAEPAVAPGS